ncbi:MAG: hypothetical protein JXR03_09920 [Cyclobacteriaceae bacterium]
MDQLNKTDDFFSSRLTSIEVEPSADSWAKVQGQIGKKVTPWYLNKVAAAILLLFTSATLVYLVSTGKEDDKNALIGETIVSPSIDETIGFESPNILSAKTQNTAVHSKKAIKKESIAIAVKKTEAVKKDISMTNMESIEILSPPRIAINFLENNQPNEKPDIHKGNNESIKLEQQRVKIIYIAKSESPESDRANDKFNRVRTVAQNVSPSNLLADLRDAKDNFFAMNMLRKN